MTVTTTAGDNAALAWTRRRVREPESAWQGLIAGAPVVEVGAADAIAGAGVLEEAAAAVLDGVVRVFTVSASGRQLTVRYCRPGDVFGLASVIAGSGVPTSAEAVTPVVIAVLPAPALRDLAMRDAEFAWSLAHEVAAVSMDGVRALADTRRRSTISKVAAHLLEWAETTREGTTVARANHQRLADASGTAREVVTRALSSLRDAGIVETRRGAVVITDPPTLARIAEGDEL